MISKNDIIKMARRVTHLSQGYKEKKTINPKREWFIGILIFLLIAVVGGVHNALNYVYFNNIEDTVVENPVTVTDYEEEKAKAALEKYRQKKLDFDSLVSNPPAAPVTEIVPSEEETATTTDDGVLRVQ